MADDKGRTALNVASDSGHLDVVTVLLELGADPNIASNDGWTPLNAALDNGHLDVFKLLLELGADPNTEVVMDVHH